MSVVHARITVRGRVQGVGYRWFARDAAAALSGPAPAAAPLSGWVRNRRDGTVELEVSGDEALLDALVERLRRGPPAAAVSAVDVQRLPATAPVPAPDPAPAPARASAGLQIRPSE